MKRVVSLVLMITGLFLIGVEVVSAQGTVPGGINYQAVARDNSGKEIVNTPIEVQFSILSGSPQGNMVYREVHTTVVTSKYGVFSLVIGKGTPVSGTFADINWSAFNHFLQVSVKFENNFMDMGTMQFMAVPYALYAAKSLEPGPAGPPGPKGDPGDPATDDQQLSYSATNRTLSLTNSTPVVFPGEVAFRARKLISDRVQNPGSNVILTYDTPDLGIGGGFDPATGVFAVPADGIYTFNISYIADGGEGDARRVFLYVNSALFETIATKIDQNATVFVKSVTARLSVGNAVTVVINTGTGVQTGTGTFSGYKVD